jgi:hypothetical protein
MEAERYHRVPLRVERKAKHLRLLNVCASFIGRVSERLDSSAHHGAYFHFGLRIGRAESISLCGAQR